MPHLIIAEKQLEYVWHGPGPAEAPTLVFLHEGLGCVAMWRGFPERVAEQTGCGALVYSRAGYGNSDPIQLPRPVRFMHEEALVTLPQVLDAFEIREAILVGHSDGGSIALIHAGGANDPRVRGLILEAPHVFVEEVGLESIRAIAREYRKEDAGRMPAHRPQDAGAPADAGAPTDAGAPADAGASMVSFLKRRLERYHGKNVDATFWGWNDVWLNPQFKSWNIEEYLPRILAPVLLIQGANDQYGTHEQVRRIEAGCSGPVRTILIADCGHSPHLDQPERTLEAMKEFVARL
jgi:pimeloyl-ACP methyl ester carboxylesterase